MADGSHDPKALRAAIGISHADERRIAVELSPAVAWPTLILALALPITLLSVIALGFTGALPLWLCTPVLAIVSYAHYTLVHESIHGNVVAKPKGAAWINTVVGWIGALGMGMGWPALQRTHVLHHSHTNTERDPDIFVKGTFVQLLRKWLISASMSLMPMFTLRFINAERYKRLGTILSPAEIAQVSAVTLFTLALLIAAVATGHVAQWLMLWFLPTRLGMLALNIFFQWLPHHPFDQTERYLNTRASLWPGGTFLLLQQNLHLVHHLWPSVPFYNYAPLFRRLRPVLKAEGSRIEGLMVGPGRRTITD
ncbi:MAG: fatty acid desaturase [Pseudomonadota bacterium]|uniref:fatty acid desaturase n=1 Tax=Phenylobacterium sp. TaxID=1871053 RepID=UPI0025F1D02E|nr:fatty acid desaturase [Phenylobacterium sp.]MBT9474088.1 fatty acid desaturase [Phenylobacterium sp.]